MNDEKEILVFGEPLAEAVDQMKKAMEYDGVYCALMADHHIGYSVPVGGVIAYEGKICVNGVGFDIGCGNKAVRLDICGDSIGDNIKGILHEITRSVSFGVGGHNRVVVEDELFDDPIWNEIDILKSCYDSARAQLGTVGAGNHYVDIFTDNSDASVWVGVHFGSRGLGHRIATHFIKKGGGKDGVHAEPVLFDENSDLGEQYIRCMELAGRYAYAGRNWVCGRVSEILEANILEEVHNHHNYAWKENHFGKDLWVVRKGATPAFPGQRGFVGGSMGDISVILEGVESKKSKSALYSTVHGAGRAMGRIQAKGKTCRKTGKKLTDGLVNKEAHDLWIKKMGVEVNGGDLDESPYAYKRLPDVLYAHSDTINILHNLTPIGVCMAPAKGRGR